VFGWLICAHNPRITSVAHLKKKKLEKREKKEPVHVASDGQKP
jgi:hypothetical protein